VQANGTSQTCLGIVPEMLTVQSLGSPGEGGAPDTGSAADTGSATEAGASDAGGGG
jgi:hypothetical protein